MMIATSCGRLAIAAAAALLASGAVAQTPPDSVERGGSAYVAKMCYTCHGYAGQGGDRGTGPRIAPDVWPYPAFAEQVRRPRAEMPRYPANIVSDQELADMRAFLSSQKPGPRAKDIPLLRD